MVKVPESQMRMVAKQVEWTGGRFKELRNMRGLRAKDVAHFMEVAYSRVFESEPGREDMKLSTFLRLCAALGVPPAKVFEGCPPFKKGPARDGQAG